MALFEPWDELGVDHRLQLQHFHSLGGPEVECAGLGNVVGAVQDALVVVAVQSAAVALQGGEGTITGADRIRGVAICCRGAGAEKNQLRHLVGELVVLHGADLHEGCQGLPGLCIGGGVVFLEVAQAVSHLFGNEIADGANAAVGLQGTAADVQRDVG